MPTPAPQLDEPQTCASDEQLAGVAQGTLGEDALEQVNRHLCECQSCRGRFEATLANHPPAPFLTQDQAEHLRPEDARLDEFLQRIGMANWRDLPDLGEQYRILEKIGQGGMGEVFKCFDTRLNRTVAVKRIRPEQISPSVLQRLTREARIQASLNHQNITRIIEIGNLAGVPFIAMEMVPGGSLKQRIALGPLAPRDAARLLLQIAQATEFAHSQGVLHRDLKPSNILLAEAEGETDKAVDCSEPASLQGFIPKIADFGLAKVLGEESDLTHSTGIIGTPAYLAPELADGQGHKATRATDIYALGVILYESLTGHPPFQANELHATLRMICEHQPVSPRLAQPGLPRDLETICLKCLEKEPSSRYKSAGELADDLERFLQGRPITARPVFMPVKVWRWCRRNRHEAAALAVALVSLFSLAAGAVYFAFVQADLRQIAESNGQLAIKETRRAQVSEVEARRQRDLARAQFEASSHVLHSIGNMLVIGKAKPNSDLHKINQQFQQDVLLLSENYLSRNDFETNSPDALALSLYNAARARDELGQPAEAIRLFEQLLDQLRVTPPGRLGVASHQQLATNATFALADIYAGQNELVKAIRTIQPLWQRPFDAPYNLSPAAGDRNTRQIRRQAGAKLRDYYQKDNQPEKARVIEIQLQDEQPATSPPF